MRNLHLILLQEYGIEVRCLFREWERLQLRTSDYKNHRIFSLRCLHKELIPGSIKLKSTLTTSKARQIIRKAEKDLLQVRVKAINNILDQVTKQTEECRAKLASIISVERLTECQGFINKVSEIRFTKVRQRQLNKFNILVTKKEGNITRANAINHTQSNSVSQPVRQASASPGEGNNTTQANTQAGALLPSREGSNQVQANNLIGSQAPLNSTPAIAYLPPREGSSLLLAAAHLPSEGSSSSQAIHHTLANATPTTLAIARLPPGEGSNSPPATVHLPLEGNSSPQATHSTPASSQASGSLPTPAIAHLPPREGSNSLPGAAHLPSGEGNSSSQVTVLLPSGEGSNSSQAASLLTNSEGNSLPQASSSTQAGQVSNPTRSLRQGNRCPPRHRSTQSSQEVNTTSWEDNPTSTPQ